jgi:hypothetical protein
MAPLRMAIALGVLLALPTGCGNGTAAAPTGRVAIVAAMGPTEPVCRSGAPCTRPYRGQVIFASPRGARITFRLSGGGRVVAAVPAGTYRVIAPTGRRLLALSTVTLDGRAIPRAQDASYSIIVRAGAVEHLRLRFDTGIR